MEFEKGATCCCGNMMVLFHIMRGMFLRLQLPPLWSYRGLMPLQRTLSLGHIKCGLWGKRQQDRQTSPLETRSTRTVGVTVPPCQEPVRSKWYRIWYMACRGKGQYAVKACELVAGGFVRHISSYGHYRRLYQKKSRVSAVTLFVPGQP